MKKNTWYTNISWQDTLVNKSNQVSMLLLSPFLFFHIIQLKTQFYIN